MNSKEIAERLYVNRSPAEPLSIQRNSHRPMFYALPYSLNDDWCAYPISVMHFPMYVVTVAFALAGREFNASFF
jgi:hypothetical protein